MKVGFIGLGIMGSRMAANLQKKGFELVVHNRTRSKAGALLQGGALWAESPADVARQVDVAFTMLATPEVVEEAALGPGGLLEGLRPGGLWVDSSTVNPSFARRMAAVAAARGVRHLDAPVSGSLKPAEQAALVFLVGGDAADFTACRAHFDAMGRQALHMGGSGMGAAAKMVVNLLLGEVMVAFSEALLLGEAQGLARETLYDFLLSSPITPPYMAGKRAKIEGADFSPEFPLQWMRKDLQLATETAYEQGLALPAGNAIKEVYALAAQRGLGEQDLSVIYAFLKGRTGGAVE